MDDRDPELSLRERKRRATRQSIQREAVRLALEDGLAAVTVDEISRRADVSSRTFFNYFASKDDALLGEAPTLQDDDALARFRAGGPTGDLLSDLRDLLVHATHDVEADRDLVHDRRRLLSENPELLSQRLASMRDFHERLADAVAERLTHAAAPDTAADAATVDATAAEREAHARLVAFVALATLRHAWSEWSNDGATDELEVRVASAFDGLRGLVSREAV